MKQTVTRLALLLPLVACAPPRVLYQPPQEALAAERAPVLVDLKNGDHLRLQGAHVRGDTLFGRQDDSASTERVIPVADVARITRSHREVSGPGGAVLGFGAGLVGGFGILLALLVGAARS